MDSWKIKARELIEKMGGEGSGNYGHAGRPGEVGGSGEGGGSDTEHISVRLGDLESKPLVGLESKSNEQLIGLRGKSHRHNEIDSIDKELQKRGYFQRQKIDEMKRVLRQKPKAELRAMKEKIVAITDEKMRSLLQDNEIAIDELLSGESI